MSAEAPGRGNAHPPPRTARPAPMKIRVLGCSGSIAAGCRTTSFLIDGDILVDAGTGVGDLTLDELVGIDHILVTHSHLDHVLSIPLLADSVARRRSAAGRPPVGLHALPATLQALRHHLFNGVIWPDFTRLPTAEEPILAMKPFEQGDVLAFGPRRVEVLPASHTVPAVGFAVWPAPGRPAWVFTGDTGPNASLWERLRAIDVAHLVIETAFSDEEAPLARISRHHCPATLGRELAGWQTGARVHLTHIKPGETDAVLSQVTALRLPLSIEPLAAGQVLSVD